MYVVRPPYSGGNKDKCRWEFGEVWFICAIQPLISYVFSWHMEVYKPMVIALHILKRQPGCGCLVAFYYLHENTTKPLLSKTYWVSDPTWKPHDLELLKSFMKSTTSHFFLFKKMLLIGYNKLDIWKCKPFTINTYMVSVYSFGCTLSNLTFFGMCKDVLFLF